jgi:hypothetical protein
MFQIGYSLIKTAFADKILTIIRNLSQIVKLQNSSCAVDDHFESLVPDHGPIVNLTGDGIVMWSLGFSDKGISDLPKPCQPVSQHAKSSMVE